MSYLVKKSDPILKHLEGQRKEIAERYNLEGKDRYRHPLYRKLTDLIEHLNSLYKDLHEAEQKAMVYEKNWE